MAAMDDEQLLTDIRIRVEGRDGYHYNQYFTKDTRLKYGNSFICACSQDYDTQRQVVDDRRKRICTRMGASFASHSYIICSDDSCWKYVFTAAELQEIINEGFHPLPPVNQQVQEIIDRFKQAAELVCEKNKNEMDDQKLNELMLDAMVKEVLKTGPFDPRTNYDEFWINTTRDRTCIATALRTNEGRKVTEVGKNEDVVLTRKGIIENELHCPKIMKDILDRVASLVDYNEEIIKKLRFICFHQTNRRMKLPFIDCPRGYTCRIMKTNEYEVLPLTKLVLEAKASIKISDKDVVAETMQVLTRYQMNKRDDGDGTTTAVYSSSGLQLGL
ncbi:hypothetical protein BDA99DRAFT_556013 [Phascolomyces articulosus]|uniref:Uncharacterized protein n=1 Tax=Phascolomyces articulosus TaxID=60185 RepID=A0AAD5K8U3_9FUNG|nr:hypothetical protein BDA99DRAFT_556013 [Phascolomyces articulosus]